MGQNGTWVVTFGVATGEEAWELRLVMKSENVRENMGLSGQMLLQSQLSGIKRFLTDELYFPDLG